MKKTGKKFLVVGSMFGLVMSMTACSNIQEHAYSIAEKTENVVTMPQQYRITYEVQEPGTETITLLTKACDSEGNIYFSYEETEMMFLKEGSNYLLCEKDANGNFVESTDKKSYTGKYVNTATDVFTELAEQSTMQFTPGFKETEETKVLGRECRVFENKIGVSGMNVTYVMQMDKESGICLGYHEISETGIFTSEPSATVFTCTEFITDKVELPIDVSTL